MVLTKPDNYTKIQKGNQGYCVVEDNETPFFIQKAKDLNLIGKSAFNKNSDNWIGVSHACHATSVNKVALLLIIFGFESENEKAEKGRKEIKY